MNRNSLKNLKGKDFKMNTFRSTVAALAAAMGLGGVVSYVGLEAIKDHEGLRYQAYPDAIYGWAVPTICYGHTKNAVRGMTATQEQCDQWLLEDVLHHCRVVDRALGNANRTRAQRGQEPIVLTQGEWDAYCSFAFNTGYFQFNRQGQTTTLYTHLVNGRRVEACQSLGLYVNRGTPAERGLTRRRTQETKTCLSDLP